MSRGRAAPPPAVSTSDWRTRLEDPDEPLFTVAVAADLLGIGPQPLRRLGESLDHDGRRPSGNQRRYSRNDLELLSRALELQGDGHGATSITRIMELERQVGEMDGQGMAEAVSDR